MNFIPSIIFFHPINYICCFIFFIMELLFYDGIPGNAKSMLIKCFSILLNNVISKSIQSKHMSFNESENFLSLIFSYHFLTCQDALLLSLIMPSTCSRVNKEACLVDIDASYYILSLFNRIKKGHRG